MIQEEYEQKRRECWKKYCEAHPLCNTPVMRMNFDWTFSRAYALGKREKDAKADEFSEPLKENHYTNREIVDDIIRKGFEGNNRLHIAAMALQGIISNSDLYQYYIESWINSNSTKPIRQVLAEVSLKVADALIEEARKSPTK